MIDQEASNNPRPGPSSQLLDWLSATVENATVGRIAELETDLAENEIANQTLREEKNEVQRSLNQAQARIRELEFTRFEENEAYTRRINELEAMEARARALASRLTEVVGCRDAIRVQRDRLAHELKDSQQEVGRLVRARAEEANKLGKVKEDHKEEVKKLKKKASKEKEKARREKEKASREKENASKNKESLNRLKSTFESKNQDLTRTSNTLRTITQEKIQLESRVGELQASSAGKDNTIRELERRLGVIRQAKDLLGQALETGSHHQPRLLGYFMPQH